MVESWFGKDRRRCRVSGLTTLQGRPVGLDGGAPGWGYEVWFL